MGVHNRMSHFQKKDCLLRGEQKGGVTLKQFWSKSLACLLCLALLVGMLPVAALAEDNPPAPAND